MPRHILNQQLTAAEAERVLGIPSRSIRRFRFPEGDTPSGRIYQVAVTSREHAIRLIKFAKPEHRRAMIRKLAPILNAARLFDEERGNPNAGALSFTRRLQTILAETKCPRPLLLLSILAHYDDWTATGVQRAERKAARVLALDWGKYAETRIFGPHANFLSRSVEAVSDRGRGYYINNGQLTYTDKNTYACGVRRAEIGRRDCVLPSLFLLASVEIPAAEMEGFITDLRSLTGGRMWRFVFEIKRFLGAEDSCKEYLTRRILERFDKEARKAA